MAPSDTIDVERLKEAAGDSSGSRDQPQLDGTAWDTLIGGNMPTESKVRVVGGAVSPANEPEKPLVKGSRHRIVIDVVSTGYGVDDTLDSETGEVASTRSTRKLKITGARYLTAAQAEALDALE